VDQSRVGPAHQGVFGRRAGRAVGYDYSNALKTSKVVWSEKTLDAWLSNPERLIPGQRMGYKVTDAGDCADLIAYLRKVSPS
jgi:cytochrome c